MTAYELRRRDHREGPMPLLSATPTPRQMSVPSEAREMAGRVAGLVEAKDGFTNEVDDRMLDVYARAENPRDPVELRNLWLGRVEHELGVHGHRVELAEQWRASRVRRTVGQEDVLNSRTTVRFVKELFNWFFRDDLYGELRSGAAVILSSGSVDEHSWGLPDVLKDCVRFALDSDWYGYSDSRGRVPAREAVARYENAGMPGEPYGPDNVALTMGGTFAISSLADFILYDSAASGPALCAVPNYPPLVEGIARRGDVRLVPLSSMGGRTSLRPLIAALSSDTPLVMLQTVGNPTGAAVAEDELAALIAAAAPTTTILLDECHEWLGTPLRRSSARAAANVVRVSSLSKNWSAPGVKAGWVVADAAFIAEYYEHASTQYGGPPSLLYTLIEVLTRMERWLVCGVDSPTRAHLAEFEGGYGLTLPRLRAAYASYRRERRAREDGLTVFRDATSVGLAELTGSVVHPRYSINTAVRFDRWDDSYLAFRELLRETGVSLLPGVLTFCLSGDVMRVTSARHWPDLAAAGQRLGGYLVPAGGRLVMGAPRGEW